ncbi:MAG: penicillin-binding protein 2 [Pseudomonadota bacterium]
MSRRKDSARHPVRTALVLALLCLGLLLLAGRALHLQVLDADFLQVQGQARHSRVVKDNSHRGMILDRNGAPLAVSTPVDSVWAHPPTLIEAGQRLPELAAALGMNARELAKLLAKHEAREFMYLKRHASPDMVARVMALKVPGVALQREYRRYYPLGQVASHVLGYTSVDDIGQEGIELAHDNSLRAIPGQKRVLKDLRGNVVELVESVVLPKAGQDLVVSLDRHVQYLAYRELKTAIETHGARGGSAVVLDAQTGEVLAMVNEPDFNPNNRMSFKGPTPRNRAVTDLFEPGSTMKPFTIAAALESGKFRPDTLIDTAGGAIQFGNRVIRDAHPYDTLTVARVIEKSSNVGASKIALALSKQTLWDTLRGVGFGQPTGSGLPGEATGVLHKPGRWVPVEQASLSFGYGLSVTPLQLARAYAAFANGGVVPVVTLLKRDVQGCTNAAGGGSRHPAPRDICTSVCVTGCAGAAHEPADGVRVFSENTAREVRAMLELAVGAEGTGGLARVADYRVAGKTGTVRKLTANGYSESHYVAWFAGLAPATNPRLVMVVAVDDPARGGYFGGAVAAPVFARVMAGALRLLDIAPDAPREEVHKILTVRNERVADDYRDVGGTTPRMEEVEQRREQLPEQQPRATSGRYGLLPSRGTSTSMYVGTVAE